MANIKLIDAQGDERTYNGVAKVKIPLADGTGNATFIQPAGKKELTDTNEVDVTNFATAQVVDENLVAENIKSGVTVLGIVGTHEGGSGGTCTGNHIIEVDTLPTENIDENAIYKCNGTYYQDVKSFDEVLVVMEGEVIRYTQMAGANGMSISLHLTENYESIDVDDVCAFSPSTGGGLYYDTSRNDVFMYLNAWMSLGTVFGATNGGAITSETEAVAENYYYALYRPSLTAIVPVNGEKRITENGTYDVKNTASVVVDVPNAVVMGVWKFNDTLNLYPIPFRTQAVNFSCGATYIDMHIETFSDNAGTWYELGFLSYKNGNSSLGWGAYTTKNGWTNGTAVTVDFGAEVQIVTSAFKEWLVANARPIYTVTITKTE